MQEIKQKVVAYITRQKNGIAELLVFDHRDFPDAGVQVPAGTVEPGEDIEQALFREIVEESGLEAVSEPPKRRPSLARRANKSLRLVRSLGQSNEWRYGNQRYYFHLEAVEDLPDAWDWTTNDYHDDAHLARGEPLIFSYRWIVLSDDIKLAGNQHRLIPLIKQEML